MLMRLFSIAMPAASATTPLGDTSISCGVMLIRVGSTCKAQGVCPPLKHLPALQRNAPATQPPVLSHPLLKQLGLHHTVSVNCSVTTAPYTFTFSTHTVASRSQGEASSRICGCLTAELQGPTSSPNKVYCHHWASEAARQACCEADDKGMTQGDRCWCYYTVTAVLQSRLTLTPVGSILMSSGMMEMRLFSKETPV